MASFKLAAKAVYSSSTDYSDPIATFNPSATTLTPDEFLHVLVGTDTGGELVELGRFDGGITLCMVKNNDTAINVTATFQTAAGATTVVIPGGGVFVTPDINYANDLTLTSASGTPDCEVFVVGT